MLFRSTSLNISTILSNSNLFIPQYSLPFGIVKMIFTVIMLGIDGVKNTTDGFICVEKSQLVANIAGGDGRSEGYSLDITINGTTSHDPDFGPGFHDNMLFMWLCRKANESFPENVEEMLPVPPEKSDAAFGGCFGSGLGPMNISSPSFQFNTGHLNLGDYVIELRIQKDKRKASFSQRLKIVLGEPPSLLIE